MSATKDQYIDKIVEKLNVLIDNSEYFIVDAFVKPTNNYKIHLDGDHGVTINAISKLNRTLRNQIDEENWFPEGDYSLEVSSPGVDTPLKTHRQYNQHIGRSLEITFLDETRNAIEAKLTEVQPTLLILEELIGKKKELVVHEIPFTDIKTAVVQISFK